MSRKSMGFSFPSEMEGFFNRGTIGFMDDMVKIFNDVESINISRPGFPYTNIIHATLENSENTDVGNDDKYFIEVALAGYKKKDIKLSLEHGILSIYSDLEQNQSFTTNELSEDYKFSYQHKGITKRGFSVKFTVSENLKLNRATMEDGILRIMFDKIVHENDTILIDIE